MGRRGILDNGIKKRTELLSPAGSLATLKAVAEAGADAVYAAGSQFGARAYAQNFTDMELLEALDYLHLKGKKLYLTVNTLLKGLELETLYGYLEPLYKAGLDAVIVQDLGVLRLILSQFPGLPVHASTQMAVTGAYGAKLMLEAGCSRIVAARELPLEEISNIYKETGMELECFVHGALCYCYSGQCLLSSMIGGRSGNRGRCAQPCRLPYGLVGGSKKENRQGQSNYLLSLKDLCAIDLLPKMVQSGVYSFKIEGRMKQAEYAAGVTRIYRKYLDKLELEPDCPYQVEDEDKGLLLALGNRCGFTNGYYTGKNGKNMVTFSSPSHEKKKDAGKGFGAKPEATAEHKEKIKGTLRLSQQMPACLMLQYKDIQVEVTGALVQPALKQPLQKQAVLEKMQKTGNTPFEFETFAIEMDENVFLTVGALNQLRREGLECLQEEILKTYRRVVQSPAPCSARKPVQREGVGEGGELKLCALAETSGQFEVILKQREVGKVYLESHLFPRAMFAQQLKGYVEQAHRAGKECYLALPYIFRMGTAKWYCSHWQWILQAGVDGYLVRNLEEVQFLKEQGANPQSMQGDYSLYAFNNLAVAQLHEMSVPHITLPVELNLKELKQLTCACGELILYGHQPLMVSSQCLKRNVSGCSQDAGVFYLKDRYGKMFPVRSQCEDCYNIIYNISPLALFHHMGEARSLRLEGARLSFTVESPGEVEDIFAYYRQAAAGALDKDRKYISDYTNGHFKRGVE